MADSKENVLIVDDNCDNLKVLVHILQSKGYAVRPARSAALAFAAMEKKKPDIILLDILMPEVSGYEICEKLKRDPETKDIPVIFISALGQPNDKVKAFSRGAVDYVTKPFHEEEVLARVATHLKLRRLHLRLEDQNRRLEREISVRIAAERSLGESEAKYHSVFETNRAIKLIVDPESGKIVDANQAACEFYGYPKSEFTEKNIADINESPPDVVREELRIALEGNKNRTELRHRVASNRLRDVEVYSGPVAIGNKVFLYSIIHDVTERKILEAELEKAKKFEAIGILAGGLSHDFNNLLNIVGGGVELVKYYSSETNKASSVFKSIETALEKAGALVRKIIDFSGKTSSLPKRMDIREMLEMLSGSSGVREGRKVAVRQPEKTVEIYADRRQLHTALSNLVQNARESMPEGGEIEIAAELAAPKDLPPEYDPPKDIDTFVKISVKDHGIGIPPENLEKIFDPYFSTKEKNEHKGMGLGLATAYSIVKRHKGAIVVASSPLQGTTVSVFFPAAKPLPESDRNSNPKELAC